MRALRVALIVALTTPAQAGVVVGAGVPFSAGELEDAIAARAEAAVGDVEVRADGVERLAVRDGDARWRVSIGPARGPVAARLVALHLVTAREEGEPGAAAGPGSLPSLPPLRAGVSAGLAVGAAATDLTATALAVELSSRGRLWLGVAAGWQRALTAEPTGGLPVRAQRWHGQVLAGARRGRFELAAGPTLGRLRVDGGATATGWHLGAAVVARAHWRLGAGWAVTTGVGAELARHRIEVRRGDDAVATTPRIAITASLGLVRDLGR